MRNIEFRAWNSKDGIMIGWESLSASPLFLSKLIKGDVDDHTLMQFTGLLDVNGAKIFEGDRVSVWDEVSTVSFNDGGFEVQASGSLAIRLSQRVAITLSLSVVGNIHEVKS